MSADDRAGRLTNIVQWLPRYRLLGSAAVSPAGPADSRSILTIDSVKLELNGKSFDFSRLNGLLDSGKRLLDGGEEGNIGRGWLEYLFLDEASGLRVSRDNAGLLYVHRRDGGGDHGGDGSCDDAALGSSASASQVDGDDESAMSSIGATSAGVRALVSSLTAVVNALGGKTAPAAAREREFASLTSEAVLDGLRRDFVQNEYLWSGQITPELYDEDCIFTDPTLSFAGLATFEANLENLDPWINRFVPATQRSCELKTIRIVDGGEAVEAEWRMLGDIALPWSPRLDLDGRTRYTLGGEAGRIVAYD